MYGKAAVLEQFGKPLVMREFPLESLAPGETRIRILAAGVCGSDLHIAKGEDPRTPLPIILGHEGIGEIAELESERLDVLGRPVKVGDRVTWERGIMCGRCYYCVIQKQPALCTTRKTYGISLSCKEPPHFQGCYAEYLHLRPFAHLIRLDGDTAPEVLVAATCAGATAAHTVERCEVEKARTVVIQGPGPVGLFCLAFAIRAGARTLVIGTAEDRERLALCGKFGADEILCTEGTTEDERVRAVQDKTRGLGADVVLDCTGSPRAMSEGIRMTAPGGTYSLPGIAVPVGEVPIQVYEWVARKNVRIQGVWVSDTRHLLRSIDLVESGRFPFEEIPSEPLPLEKANLALERMARRQVMKAVLRP